MRACMHRRSPITWIIFFPTYSISHHMMRFSPSLERDPEKESFFLEEPPLPQFIKEGCGACRSFLFQGFWGYPSSALPTASARGNAKVGVALFPFPLPPSSLPPFPRSFHSIKISSYLVSNSRRKTRVFGLRRVLVTFSRQAGGGGGGEEWRPDDSSFLSSFYTTWGSGMVVLGRETVIFWYFHFKRHARESRFPFR